MQKTSENKVSLLLNKGLRVFSVQNDQGKRFGFVQDLKSFYDLKTLKVNRIIVSLDEIGRGEKCTCMVSFGGHLVGYKEVFSYVQDAIGKDYSLIRLDAFSYPLIGTLNFKRLIKNTVSQSFYYDLKVTVPNGYVVACGGELLSKSQRDEKVIYSYTNPLPTWRIDVAVARFKVIEARNLKAYTFPEDLSNAKQLLKEMEKVSKFYENWFRFSPKSKGYALIEIPKGWGSQAGVNYMLLDEESFKRREKISGLYHELAHLWNVSSGEKFSSRFFDEGFACYFQALAEKQFLGDKVFNNRMKAFQQKFNELCKKDTKFFEIPMFRYGEFGLTDASYSKGAWALYALHKLLGDQKFKEAIGTFLQKHREKPATIEDFKKHITTVSGRDLKRFFDEWFFNTQSSIYLTKGIGIDKIVAKYGR